MLFGTNAVVFQDKKLCVCPVFLKNIAIFVLNEIVCMNN